MFEFIRTHQRLMQLMLLLLIVPSFAFLGVQGYSSFRDRESVIAKVAGQSITQQEWNAAQRAQMERFQQMFGAQFDPKMLDTPAARQGILDNLIAQRVIAVEAMHEHLSVSNQTLQQTILGIPGLTTPDGKFDVEHYKSLLAMQGLTPAGYEAQLRQELAQRQVRSAIEATAFVPKTVAERVSSLRDQEREVQALLFKPSDYAAQVKVTDDMLKAYYDKHIADFEIPEQLKIEYVVLDGAAAAAQIQVSDADIKSYYDQNIKQYTEGEQRRARHILIKADKSASKAERDAARAKAEKLLAEVRKNPDDFARLAKKYSEDTGSAERGGDLDFFGKGMMVKPFEDTVFSLKPGEISGLVKSDFGYHIIQLTEIRPAAVKPLDEVRNAIAADIRKQLAAKKFSEMADLFSNTVYEQSDSLQPVADKLHLKIESVSGLTRTPNPAAAKAPYNQPKFLNAIFSGDALRNKHNTDAVEVAPNTLIAGRVVEYKPVTREPLDAVKPIVRERVIQTEAAELAKKDGAARLSTLQTAGAGDASGFGNASTVSREKAEGMQPAAFDAVMKADTRKLPAYVGVDLKGQGYGIYRINKVSQPEKKDPARSKAEQQQLASVLAEQELYAYLEALKKKAKVQVLKPVTAGAGTADGR